MIGIQQMRNPEIVFELLNAIQKSNTLYSQKKAIRPIVTLLIQDTAQK